MWQQKDNTFTKEFVFAGFKDALEFVNRVGALAEQANHHPRIELDWNKVKIYLTSHDVGGVTERDKNLANQIDNLNTNTNTKLQ